MSYEKPELLVLSVAAKAVRGSDNATNQDGSTSSNVHESGHSGDTGDSGTTSSAAAYQMDE